MNEQRAAGKNSTAGRLVGSITSRCSGNEPPLLSEKDELGAIQ